MFNCSVFILLITQSNLNKYICEKIIVNQFLLCLVNVIDMGLQMQVSSKSVVSQWTNGKIPNKIMFFYKLLDFSF